MQIYLLKPYNDWPKGLIDLPDDKAKELIFGGFAVSAKEDIGAKSRTTKENKQAAKREKK